MKFAHPLGSGPVPVIGRRSRDLRRSLGLVARTFTKLSADDRTPPDMPVDRAAAAP